MVYGHSRCLNPSRINGLTLSNAIDLKESILTPRDPHAPSCGWSMVYDLWSIAYGLWPMIYGQRTPSHTSESPGHMACPSTRCKVRHHSVQ